MRVQSYNIILKSPNSYVIVTISDTYDFGTIFA